MRKGRSKNAYGKDIGRAILKGRKRFCAIMLITVLGVMMFSGLTAACVDLRKSADRFFDAQNLHDLCIVSTLGLTDEDVRALANVDGVSAAEGLYSETVHSAVAGGGLDVVLQTLSAEGIDVPYIVEGRLPEKAGEIAVTEKYARDSDAGIGDRIVITEEEDDEEEFDDVEIGEIEIEEIETEEHGNGEETESFAEDAGAAETVSEAAAEESGGAEAGTAVEAAVEELEDSEAGTAVEAAAEELEDSEAETVSEAAEESGGRTFVKDEFIITGIVVDVRDIDNPFGSVSYRTSSTGKPTAFVTKDAADTGVYTAVYLTVDGASALFCYADKYEEKVAAVREYIEDQIREERQRLRSESVRRDAQDKLDEAVEKVNAKLAEALQKLEDGERELAKKEKEGRDELDEGWQTLTDSLAEAEEKLRDGEQELIDSLAEARQALADAEDEWQAGKETYDASVEELSEQEKKAKKEFEAAEAELAKSRKQLDDAKKQIEDADVQLTAGEAEVAQQLETVERQLAAVNEKIAEFATAGMAFIDVRWVWDLLPVEVFAAASNVEEVVDVPTESEGQGSESQGSESESGQSESQGSESQSGGGESQNSQSESQGSESESSQSESGDDPARAAYEQLLATKRQLEEARKTLKEKEKELKGQREELEKSRAEYEAGEAEYAAGVDELSAQRAAAEAQIAEARTRLAAARRQIEAGRASLDAAWDEYYDGKASGEAELADGWAEYEDAKRKGEQKLADGEKELEEGIEEGREKLDDGWSKYNDGRKEADDKFEDAQKKIEDIDTATWYVQDRSSLSGYANVRSDADSIEAIATVFPIVFLIVAVLVSLTTITRMIEEDRGLIGTYKSLGYTDREIRRKYMVYSASACAAGGIIGTIMAFLALPAFIFTIFKIMYLIPGYDFSFVPLFGALGPAIFFAAICGATYLAVRGELNQVPAALMRPKAPRAGSRVLLERITPIWGAMSFLNKVTARNLFRYKKRMLMTIFGIAGCMALLLFGFAIRDSVTDLMPRQYQETFLYDMMTVAPSADDGETMTAALDAAPEVDRYIRLFVTSAKLKANGAEENVQLLVLKNGADLAEYIHLEDIDGNAAALCDGDIYVTQNAGNVMHFEAGDAVEMQLTDLQTGAISVTKLVKNYLGNYVYMTEATYLSYYEDFEENGALVLLASACADQTAFADGFGERKDVASCVSIEEMREQFSGAFRLINMVVYIVIALSAALAFVVLFTLSTTNISEREREIATIKVLGFFDGEVHSYIDKETAILTAIGIVIGLPLGWAFAQTLTVILNLPSIYLAVSLHRMSFGMAAGLSAVFAVLVMLIMDRSLDAIDPVEALKSVE